MVTGDNKDSWPRLMAEEYYQPPEAPDYRNHKDTLYMGELVEPLGFDSIWATEHYGSAHSMQPNPLLYLANWGAGRVGSTWARWSSWERGGIRPGWQTEISMLKIRLRGRRLHLGIGHGIAPHEYASLGYPIEQPHKYFYDVIIAIKAADGTERF